MSLNIQTEVNLDMTVRITGRDQVTGADIGKLNALFEAVESLGGTINYPNPSEPTNQNFINCTYNGYSLTYTGGVIDFNDGQGAVPALLFPFELTINETAIFKLSNGAYESLMLSVDDGSTVMGFKNSTSLFISHSNEVAAATNEMQMFKNFVLDQSIDISAFTDFNLNVRRYAEMGVLAYVRGSDFEEIGATTEMDNLNVQRGWLAVKFAAPTSNFSINTIFERIER